jgi:translation initiation factor IF-1
MVKNITGGNKAKSISRSKIGNKKHKAFKAPNYDLDDVIGKITKSLGNGRFEAKCFAEGMVQDINCSVPRKIRIGINDLVIINVLRDNKKTHESLGYIIYKYEPEHYSTLKDFDIDYIKENKLSRPDIIKILKYEQQDRAHEAIAELFDDLATIPTKSDVFADIDVDDI